MKLIIEIDEDYYNNIEPFLNGETIKVGFNLFKALEIIKNGTPLDDLRAEIEQKKYRRMQIDLHTGFNSGIECALRVIDRYMEGENE